MRRRGVLAVIVAGVLLIGLVGGGVLYSRTRAAQAQVRALLETVLSRDLEMPVRIGRFSFSPALNRVEARSVALLERDGGPPLLTVDRVRVSVDLWALLRGQVEVRSIVLRGPRLDANDSPELRQRLARLTARLRQLSRGAATARVPVTVENASIRYRHEPLKLTAEVDALRIALEWPTVERARLTIRSDAVNVAVAGRAITAVSVDGELLATSDLVEATRLTVARGRSALSFEGIVWSGTTTQDRDLTTAGALDLSEVAALLGAPRAWKGVVTVQGSLSGGRPPREFKGTLAVDGGVLYGLPVTHAEARVSLGQQGVVVPAFSARSEGGVLSGTFSYEPDPGAYRFAAQLDRASLTALLQAAGRPEKLSGRLTGRVEGRGRGRQLDEFVGQGEVVAEAVRLEGSERSAEVAARGSVRKGLVSLDRLTVRSGSGALSGRGSLAPATGAMDFTLRLSVERLEQALWPREIRGLGGRLTAAGRVTGRVGDPHFVGQVAGQELRLGAVRLDRVEGLVEADRHRLASRALRAVVGSSTATVSGEARLPDLLLWPGGWEDNLVLAVKVDLQGRAEDLRSLLPPAWPAVAGPLSLQLSVQGSPLALSGGGRMEMREMRVGAERWELLRAALVFKGKDLTVPRLTLRRRGVTVQGEGRVDLAGRYSVALAPVALDLATLPRLGERGGKGIATLKVWGSGALAEPRLEGEISLSDGALHGVTLGSAAGTFSLDRGLWHWSVRLASGYQLRGTAPFGLAGRFTTTVTAANADLGPLLGVVQSRLRFPLTARADGSATLTGVLPDLSGVSGEIELAALRGHAGGTPWQARGVTRLKLESGTLRLEPLELVGPGLSVTLRGTVKPGERSEIELAGHAPFAILEPWVPAVAAVRGVPEIRLTLAGRPGELAVNGVAELRTVDVRFRALPVWWSVGRGEVTFTRDRVQFRVTEGRAAGGRLEGRGEARRQHGRWAHAVEFTLDRADLAQLYDEWMAQTRWASGALSLKGSLAFETGAGLFPLQTLGGKLAMTVEGGNISRYPVLIRIFGLVTSLAQPARLPDLTREQMPYRRITGDFALANGVMESKNLVLDSEVARMSGVGKVSLPDKTLDLNIALRPLQVLEQGIRRIPLLGRVLPREQSLGVVYFDVDGSWGDPQVAVAPIKTLGQSVVELLLLLLRAPDRLLLPRSEER